MRLAAGAKEGSFDPSVGGVVLEKMRMDQRLPQGKAVREQPAAPGLPPQAVRERVSVFGWFCGFFAVVVWGSYIAYARSGVAAGLTPLDFAVIRFVPSGLLMLPFLLLRGPRTLGGVGWPRGLLLVLLTGPAFVVLSTQGFTYAPLAHGAVLQPGTATIVALGLAIIVLRERPEFSRLVGSLIVLMGLVFVAGSGFFVHALPESWKGDLMFASAGACWGIFTVLLKRWQVDAISATAIIAVLSALIVVPLYIASGALAHLLSLPVSLLVTQALIQGVFSQVLAMLAFSQAVKLLGGGRSATFPALVPATAILLGIPVAGEWPNGSQIVGLVIVSLGLLLSIGVIRFGRRTLGRAV